VRPLGIVTWKVFVHPTATDPNMNMFATACEPHDSAMLSHIIHDLHSFRGDPHEAFFMNGALIAAVGDLFAWKESGNVICFNLILFVLISFYLF
jgi:hypothetical protein